MKRAIFISTSTIVLTLMLLGTVGVSIERCSCTGRLSLAVPAPDDCCPGEGNCMTVKTLHLSEYVPTATASLDIPSQPLLYTLFVPLTPVTTFAPRQSTHHSADSSPGAMAETVTVLRV
ncbi:MAG: hypothetical protein IKM79_00325 [Bacteroidales bacterium]|nr:hypothetical protein [Bacteroidales bacterium]